MRSPRAALGVSLGALLCGQRALAQESEVVVRALPRSESSTESSITGERARGLAGTQGDAVKAVQNMPGFGRGGVASEPIAWGAAPRDTRILVDGVEVPSLYHGSGIRSVVPTEQVQSVHASPGAYDARFGRGVGGLVRVITAPPDLVQPRWAAAADFLDVSAYASQPLLEGKSAAAVSGRYGYVDRWFSSLVSPSLRGSLYVIPSYWDAHGEVAHVFANGTTSRYVLRTSSDSASTQMSSSDPARTRAEHRSTRFARLYAEHALTLADGAKASVTPFLGWDDTAFASRSGDSTARRDVSALRYGLRSSVRIPATESLVVELGVDANGASSEVHRNGSLAIPRREGDSWPLGTLPDAGLVSDAFHVQELDVALFVRGELRWGPLHIEPALRVDAALDEVNRDYPSIPGVPDAGMSAFDALLEPRLAAHWRLSKPVTLYVAWGRYHQLPVPEDLGAVAGNPRLAPVAATHLVVGERVEFASGWLVEVRGYRRDVDHVAVRNPAQNPALARSLLDTGQARSFGAELMLRARSLYGVEGWLTLSLSRSEQIESGNQRYRLSDWDTPFALTAVAKRRLGRFGLSGRLRWTSGNPRTPVVDVLENVSSGRTQPIFGTLNSRRLPAFFQLDLRVDREFALSRDTRLTLYLDLLNVTAHRNAEDIVYSSNFKSSAWVSGLPPMAIVGARIER